jgi:CheY-like chemotaxis protein
MGKKVLLIDDEPTLHEMMRLILELGGYEMAGISGRVDEEVSGEKRPDLIILDLMMPEVSGFEVLKKLKEDAETRDIPVIICSVRHFQEDMELAYNLGAVRYITKPFEPNSLLQAIDEVLAGAGKK